MSEEYIIERLTVSKKIAAIIVTYNPDIEILQQQVEILLSQVQIIVYVDNASLNASRINDFISLIDKERVQIILIENEDNKGLGFAQNRGIEAALAEQATQILLLDDDSVIEEHFIDNLLHAKGDLTERGIKVGAIGPTYYNKDSGEQYPITKYVGPFIDRRLPKETSVEASFLIASGCLIESSVIEEVGLLNEDFFIDYIDVEWSFRAISMGYKLYATPHAKMNHIIGEKRVSIFGRKISLHSPLRKYYLFRNSVFMIKCPYISTGYKIRELIFNGLRLVVFLLLSNEKKKYFKYSVMGYWDGLRNKKGKCTYNY